MLLVDTAQVVDGALRLAQKSEIVAVDGTPLPTAAASVCLHGDTPRAVEHAVAVRAALVEAGIRMAPFAVSEPRSGTMTR